MIRKAWLAIVSTFLFMPVVFAQQAASEQFRPANELPPDQQLPAAAFLIGAYAFIWVALIFYLWTIWRRLDRVEKDMRALNDKSRSHAR